MLGCSSGLASSMPKISPKDRREAKTLLTISTESSRKRREADFGFLKLEEPGCALKISLMRSNCISPPVATNPSKVIGTSASDLNWFNTLRVRQINMLLSLA